MPSVIAGPYPFSGSTILLRDTFTDTNGTLLQNHTPDENDAGNAWANPQGDYEIQDGALQRPSGATATSDNAGTIQLAAPASEVEGAVSWDSDVTTRGGVVTRAADGSNFFTLYVGSNPLSHSHTEQNAILYERTGGTITNRAQSTEVYGAGSYTLKLTDDGTTLRGYMDGTEVLSYASTAKASNAGVGAVVAFDSFYVDSLEVLE